MSQDEQVAWNRAYDPEWRENEINLARLVEERDIEMKKNDEILNTARKALDTLMEKGLEYDSTLNEKLDALSQKLNDIDSDNEYKCFTPEELLKYNRFIIESRIRNKLLEYTKDHPECGLTREIIMKF